METVAKNSWIRTLCSTLIGQHVIIAGIANNQQKKALKIAGYARVNYKCADYSKKLSAERPLSVNTY